MLFVFAFLFVCLLFMPDGTEHIHGSDKKANLLSHQSSEYSSKSLWDHQNTCWGAFVFFLHQPVSFLAMNNNLNRGTTAALYMLVCVLF